MSPLQLSDPQWLAFAPRWFDLVMQGLSRASAIITISEDAKADIANYCNFDPALIHVVYHWVPSGLIHAATLSPVSYTTDPPYILSVGEVAAKKNQLRSVEA